MEFFGQYRGPVAQLRNVWCENSVDRAITRDSYYQNKRYASAINVATIMKWASCVVSISSWFYGIIMTANNQLVRYSISANCYKRIREETKLMQQQIETELGLNPVDKDVVVLYDGEKDSQVDNNQITSNVFKHETNKFLS